jgi:hypothetical protein
MAVQLTQEEQNKLFKHIADTHIDLANAELEAADIHIVTSGFIYGAARFNAFSIASGAKNLQEYKEIRKEAMAHYTQVFQKMLEENLDNYQSSFTEQKEKSPYSHLIKNK